MGKALMVASSIQALGSGDEISLLGYQSDTTSEGNAQVSCTEAAVFSNLRANIISGGSGTNTFQFRDAGANGSQVINISGAASGEDTTNTDTLSAADLFNLAYTDTGTNSTISWVCGNVALSSGHGNFHGVAAYGGVVFDVQSETRFISLAGYLLTDGSSTEDNTEWKVRGYDTFEALQVRITANARTNTSTFTNRINGGAGTGSIPYAASATGLVSDTGLADAISDGQTVNAAVTLDTGLEDLTIAFVIATLKSSTNKSESWAGSVNGRARTASSTAGYNTIGGIIPGDGVWTETQARIKPGFAAVVSNLRCYLSDNTYASNGTLKLYQNGSAVITLTLTASGGAAWYENTSDSITIDADDELSFEFDEGGASGSITIQSAGITFAPAAAVTEGVLYGPRNYTDGISSFWSR